MCLHMVECLTGHMDGEQRSGLCCRCGVSDVYGYFDTFGSRFLFSHGAAFLIEQQSFYNCNIQVFGAEYLILKGFCMTFLSGELPFTNTCGFYIDIIFFLLRYRITDSISSFQTLNIVSRI